MTEAAESNLLQSAKLSLAATGLEKSDVVVNHSVTASTKCNLTKRATQAAKISNILGQF